VVNLNVLSQLLEVAIISGPPEKAPVVGLVMRRMRFIKELRHWRYVNLDIRIEEHRNRKPFLGLVHHHTVLNSAVFVIAPDLEDGPHVDHKCILARFHCYPLSVLPLDLNEMKPKKLMTFIYSQSGNYRF